MKKKMIYNTILTHTTFLLEDNPCLWGVGRTFWEVVSVVGEWEVGSVGKLSAPLFYLPVNRPQQTRWTVAEEAPSPAADSLQWTHATGGGKMHFLVHAGEGAITGQVAHSSMDITTPDPPMCKGLSLCLLVRVVFIQPNKWEGNSFHIRQLSGNREALHFTGVGKKGSEGVSGCLWSPQSSCSLSLALWDSKSGLVQDLPGHTCSVLTHIWLILTRKTAPWEKAVPRMSWGLAPVRMTLPKTSALSAPMWVIQGINHLPSFWPHVLAQNLRASFQICNELES